MRNRNAWWVALVLLYACGDDEHGPPDAAGAVDAAGAIDAPAAPVDAAASADAPGVDAMGVDAMGVDAMGVDAMSVDATSPDAPPPDASTVDAAPAPDASGDSCATSELRLTNASGFSEGPVLAWNGTGFGVAWSDARDGNTEVYFARLDAAGVPIGSAVRVTDDAANQEGVAIAWTGTEYGLTWYDLRDGNYELYFARMDGAGAKIGGDVRVTNDAGRSWGQTMASNGSGYAVTWWENRDGNDEIYFALLDAAGAKTTADVRVTSDSASSNSPDVVWTGSGYGIAWSDSRDGNSEIYFAQMDAAGDKVGGDVRVTTATGSSGLPSIVWNGTGYAVGWEDTRSGAQELYVARLDAAGAKLGSDTYLSQRLFSPWNMVWTGTEYALAWPDDRDGNLEIYFARVDSSGTKIGVDLRVTNDGAISHYPSMAWTGSGFGVVWSDFRDPSSEIYYNAVCP